MKYNPKKIVSLFALTFSLSACQDNILEANISNFGLLEAAHKLSLETGKPSPLTQWCSSSVHHLSCHDINGFVDAREGMIYRVSDGMIASTKYTLEVGFPTSQIKRYLSESHRVSGVSQVFDFKFCQVFNGNTSLSGDLRHSNGSPEIQQMRYYGQQQEVARYREVAERIEPDSLKSFSCN